MELSCRCCLTSVNNKLLPLSMMKNGQTLREIVIFLSGVEINEYDCLPQKICEDCIKQISEACEVKQKVVNTDNLLREKFREEISMVLIKVEEPEVKVEEPEFEVTVKIEKDSDPVCEETKPLQFEACDEENSNTMEADFTSEKTSDNIEIDLKSTSISKKSRRKTTKGHFNCTLCDRTFKIQKFFERHLELHRTKKRPNVPEDYDYECHICLLKFMFIMQKQEHIKKDHAEEKICRICKKKCQTPIALETHIKSHFQEYQFMCHICAKKFRYDNKLEHHMKEYHSNDVKYICDLCGLTTQFKPNIIRHMKTVHLKLKDYKCIECKDLPEFSTLISLNIHNYRHHGLEAPVNCPDCNLGFTFPAELRAHKKYKNCSNKYNNYTRVVKRVVKRVKSNHDFLLKNGKFLCKICQNTFDTNHKWFVHNYQKHAFSNKCESCDLQFTSYSSLLRHIKVKHNHIKPFKCEFCDKTFGQKVAMISHRNTHTGEKPLSCAFCAFKTGDNGTLSKHKKKMHPEQMMK